MRKVTKLECWLEDGDHTGNRYPLYVSLSGQFIFKKEPHIGDTETLFSLITLIISPNERLIQPSNISGGETHKS